MILFLFAAGRTTLVNRPAGCFNYEAASISGILRQTSYPPPTCLQREVNTRFNRHDILFAFFMTTRTFLLRTSRSRYHNCHQHFWLYLSIRAAGPCRSLQRVQPTEIPSITQKGIAVTPSLLSPETYMIYHIVSHALHEHIGDFSDDERHNFEIIYYSI